jgi:flagellar basal-body rod modification protein FlgD
MTTIPSTSTVGTGASSVSNAIDNTEIASNFTTFLQLLTTQLKNQNPLDPLDTNQFTQQLVEFAQVEQQMKSNKPGIAGKERCGDDGARVRRRHGRG